MTFIIPVLIFLLSIVSVLSQESTGINSRSSSDSVSCCERIKILSWNIYMLPRFIKNSGKMERAEVIGKELLNKDYDVIVFQEAFHSGARKRIRNELEKKYYYSAGPANQKAFSFKTNSGIWIFSKFPIVASKSIIFENRCGIDAFSRKGALIVELNVHGKLIQIVGTHLQSSGFAWVKHSQCVELAERLINPFQKPGIPQIICGDFNIEKGSEYHYNKMLQMLDATDSELKGTKFFTFDELNNDLHDQVSPKQGLIDYILFKANKCKVNFLNKQVSVFQFPWHKRHNDLSDHYPLEAEILFDNTPSLSVLY
jgi:endonuclease/exonuclease/phosphatase family metal-dependent hydrolase